jgi:hypothetical protein
MVSTESHVARALHRHARETDNLEQELADEQFNMEAELDRKHAGAKQAARDEAATSPPSGGRPPVRMPQDADHERHKSAELAKQSDKHDQRRKANRHRQRAELEKARKIAPTAEKHVPQREPMEHQGAAFTVWLNLNAARREAMLGVFRSTAKLRDDADSEHLNLSKSSAGTRYMGVGQKMADDASDRLVHKHLDIRKREQHDLDLMAGRFEREIEDDKRTIHRQAAERGDMEKRHYAERNKR